MPTVDEAKSMAKSLETALRARNIAVSRGACLDIVARQLGLKDWNVLSAQAKSAQAKRGEAAAPRRARALTGWDFLAEHPEVYDHGADGEAAHRGQGAALVRLAPASAPPRYPDLSRAFGTYMQTVSAVPFRGRRLEVRARPRCAGVSHGATIWARVDARPGHTLAFDNLKHHPEGWLFGDAPWSARTIVIDVAADAVAVHFGFFLKGTGALWAAEFAVAAVDASVPLTAPQAGAWRAQPAWTAPVNLHFSETVDPFGGVA